jgi:hypothetical protein
MGVQKKKFKFSHTGSYGHFLIRKMLITGSRYFITDKSLETVNRLQEKRRLSNEVWLNQTNTTRHGLVVCGVSIWLFDDFLGFTSTLKEQNPPVNGYF